MESLPTYTNTLSLSESYGECIQSYRTFLLALSEDSCVVHLKQVHLPEILEGYGRTKIWGDQTKADLPARARGSLDDTLRHDDELKRLVQGILVRIRALLVQATSIAKRKYDPAVGSDRDSISSVSAESDSDLDDDGEYQRQRMPKIRLFVQQMLEQIQSLYDLSSLLRRPKIADKYIRSINSKLNIARLSDSDTLSLSVALSILDESHIEEKMLQWRGLTKSGRSVAFKDEDVAPMGQGLTSHWAKDILWLCHRLARANTRRREQLQYWTNHPYDPMKDATNATRLAIPDMAQVPTKQEKQESQSQTSTAKPPDPDFSREGPRSALSKQSFSTAAVSDIHDTKTNVRPRTVYAPTAIGQGRSNSVPDPPKPANENATFSCPYCGMTLESSEMQNRQSWKRHVFHDLRPYVCTFEDCQNAGKLYVSRHDWIYHELQIHRRKYVCKECDKTYPNRKEISTHLPEHYGESISPARLGVILDLCNRQVDISNDDKDSCLICAEELPLSTLQGHLAAHMEDIALFVLPSTDVEEETGGSRASVIAAKLKSKGKRSDSESEASSLGFSAAGSHGQTSAEFVKILTSEEMGYTSKFSSWRTTDEDQKSTSTIRTQSPSEEDRRAESELPYPAELGHKLKDSDSRMPLSRATAVRQTLEGHSGHVFAVAFSPDGETLASGSSDETVKVWNARSGAILQTLEGHSGKVYAVAFSPDGKTLASGSDDESVMVWDVRSGSVLQTLEGHRSSVYSVAFSPDGKTLASASSDGTVKVWDARSGAILQALESQGGLALSVAFSPDGETMASALGDGTVKVWDARSGAILQTLEGHGSSVYAVAFSPDGKVLASSSSDGTVKVWDARSGAILQTLEGHRSLVYAVAFSPDGKTLASGSSDGTVKVWNTRSGAILQTLEDHSGKVYAVAFSPDGKVLASGLSERTVKLWDTARALRIFRTMNLR